MREGGEPPSISLWTQPRYQELLKAIFKIYELRIKANFRQLLYSLSLNSKKTENTEL